MVRIVLIADPETGRALYSNEQKELGSFDSIANAFIELGDKLVSRFCNIYTA